MFWLVAGALLLAAAVALGLGLRRGRAVEAPALQDLQVYRDQLAEIERDLARGVIATEEAARLKTEVSRRILETDRLARQAGGAGETRGPGGNLLIGFIVLLLAGSVALYWHLGAPGYPDMPLTARLAEAEELHRSRPDQTTAEADAPKPPAAEMDAAFLDLMTKLRATVAQRPQDIEGQRLLAQNEGRLGDFKAAYTAQRQVITLLGDTATAEDHAGLAELMIFAAGGYVSPEAEAELSNALALDPQNGTARYYAGLMFAQLGRADRTFVLWRDLLEGSPADAPWMPVLRARIGEIADKAGVRYTPPGAGVKGPDAAAMQAAAGMGAGDRAAMIEGMVQQLSDRLGSAGGSPEEWAQLINALGVLGRKDEAAAQWAAAQAAYAGQDTALATIGAAAQAAGVAP